MKYALGLIVLFNISCTHSEPELTANEIVDRAIEFSGKTKLKENTLKFTFRTHNYTSIPTCDGFRLERSSRTQPIKDVLYKGELNRYVKDSLVQLPDSTAFEYTESVNSVHYFMQLPLRLKDDAVKLKRLGTEVIDEQSYHKIKVTFSEHGGGEDYQDIYMYWFDETDFSMDYLAYSFIVNGGGVRFRKAINRREIDGVIFQDYENYNPKRASKYVDSLGIMYERDQLELLSMIEKREIAIQPKTLNCN